jgi:DNA-binding response OmpR family regulator
MKILIIEDEKKIISFLKKGLKSEGHMVEVCENGEDGLFEALEGEYDLLIIDLGLPKLGGILVCKKVREKKSDIPIIMLTAKDAVEDRIKGLDAGADDYITKPFSFAELLARIRALLRRKKGSVSSAFLTAHDLVLNTESFEVLRSGKPIKLSATEFKILKYLMENQHKVISKTVLLEAIWGYNFSPESNIVEVYINFLRDKIDKKFSPHLIQTIHGMGYRICP